MHQGFPQVDPWQPNALLSSNAAAVPLSATPLWALFVFIQPLVGNPGDALFGTSAVSPAQYGFRVLPGDMVLLPFPSPVPLHKTYYYQLGGAGQCAIFAGQFVNEYAGH